MQIMQAEDAINGREGYATAVIDGKVEELMELADITVTIELNKTEFKAMGTRNTQQKVTGWNGTGTMTVRYGSKKYLKILVDYIHTGKIVPITLVVTNNDPGSRAGKQVVQILGVIIDGADVAKLALDDDIEDQDINFSFNDINVLEEFNDITY